MAETRLVAVREQEAEPSLAVCPLHQKGQDDWEPDSPDDQYSDRRDSRPVDAVRVAI